MVYNSIVFATFSISLSFLAETNTNLSQSTLFYVGISLLLCNYQTKTFFVTITSNYKEEGKLL